MHALWGYVITSCDMNGECTFAQLPYAEEELTTEGAYLLDMVGRRISKPRIQIHFISIEGQRNSATTVYYSLESFAVETSVLFNLRS